MSFEEEIKDLLNRHSARITEHLDDNKSTWQFETASGQVVNLSELAEDIDFGI